MRSAISTAGLGLVVTAVLLPGCGKGDLRRSTAARIPPARPAPATAAAGAPAPGPLTARRAAAFAAAVNLTAADIPAGEPSRRNPQSEGEEEGHCADASAHALGGAQSPLYERGTALTRETIASGVAVLHDQAQARRDLAYANSAAGIACYTKVARHSLRSPRGGNLRLGNVHVSRLHMPVAGAAANFGLRVTASVSSARGGPTIRLYVDALAFLVGQAEVELFTTSLVQPVPARTEQELLALMMQRARLHPL